MRFTAFFLLADQPNGDGSSRTVFHSSHRRIPDKQAQTIPRHPQAVLRKAQPPNKPKRKRKHIMRASAVDKK
jgi:hypothetical protein